MGGHRYSTVVLAALIAALVLPSQAAAAPAIGLLNDGRLVTFDTAAPGTITSGPTTVKGLQPNERLVGIDALPATGNLYGIGGSSRIYAIDLAAAQATQLGPSGLFTLSGASFGVDFNPVSNRARVHSDAEQNLRLNVNDGTSETDSPLAYGAGDPHFGQNPDVSAAAYTNSFAGSQTTTLYGIDAGLDLLVIVNPPNNGTLNTVGPLGMNAGPNTGFDIASTAAPPTNTAFAALTPSGATNTNLYSVSLATGAVTLLGPIATGGGLALDGLALGVSGVLPADPVADTAAPETTIVSKKLKKRAKGKAKIRFSGSDDVTAAAALAFECRRDKKDFAACTSPVVFKKLKSGKHTIDIRAVDAAGNADASLASVTFKVRRKRR